MKPSAPLLLALLTLVVAVPPVSGQPPQRDPYAPFQFLIGEWESLADGQVGAIMRFAWGPRRSHIVWTAERVLPDGTQRHAFDGILAWNPVRRKLEFLIPLGRAMERGDFDVHADGSLQRNIEVFYPGGVALPPDGSQRAPEGGYIRQYRQRFQPVGADSIRSSVHYLTEDGQWVASFPGADDLLYRRVGSDDRSG